MKLIGQKILPLILLLFQGCYYDETVESKIIIRESYPYKFELEIPIHVKGRGNIHTLDIKKIEFENSDWIYTNTINGKVTASEIIFTNYYQKTDPPWIQSNLRGYLEFFADSVSINLEIPRYIDDDSIPEKWIDYNYNGKYLLEQLTE
jgi:protein associated with RNAse G/E